MNLSTRQIRAFVAIARLQSFTRAAEQMHITQAGLSSMLRDVEVQLGCRLFNRTTRVVALTVQGRAFLPVAERVLAELDGAAASLGELTLAERQSLQVGATPLVASCVLPQVCQAFAAQHPDVTVTVHDLDRLQIQERVQSGELDAGFGVFLEAASGLRRVPLCKTTLVLVSSAASRGAATLPDRALRWTDLARVPLLSLPVRNPIQQCVDAHLAPIGRGNEPRRAFSQLHTLLAMVEAGAESAVLPSFVAAAAGRYRVSVRPLTRPRVTLDFYEITRTGRPRGDALEAFGRLLVGAMKKTEALDVADVLAQASQVVPRPARRAQRPS